jgi:hypothetical protein
MCKVRIASNPPYLQDANARAGEKSQVVGLYNVTPLPPGEARGLGFYLTLG